MEGPQPATLPDWATSHNDSPYFRLLGIRVEEVARDYAKLSCIVRPEVIHVGGMMNGGVTAAMADLAVVMALYSDPEIRPPMPTIQMSISYLSAAREGELVLATARILRRGKHIGVGEVQVTNAADGRLMATATVNCSIRVRREP